jgi:hypothetical protein
MRRIIGKKVLSITGSLFALCASFGLIEAKDAKLEPNEVVSRHLNSIGSPEKLKARKTCVLEGDGAWRFVVGGAGSLAGPAVFVSEGDRFQFNIQFNHANYPSEQFAFDGEKLETGFPRPGIRSRLGQFLFTHNSVAKEGLLGGVLSTGWTLAELEKRNPRLHYDGLKKFDGKQLHELQFAPKKGGDLSIFLYFDPETFRHIATVYRLIIPAQIAQGGPDESARQKESRFELVERFDTFQEVEGLTLPTHWNLRFTVETDTTTITEWDMRYSKVTLNQAVDPKVFKIQ